MNQFPQTSKYLIRAVSNLFKNSRRYSQLKIAPQLSLTQVAKRKNLAVDTSDKFAAGINNSSGTGGKI
jgi:hypothetical protein